MKQTVFVIFLLLLLATGCFLSIHYIENSAGKLEEKLSQLEAAVTAAETEQAQSLLRETQAMWDKTSGRWEIFIDHDNIRDIEIGLTDLETALLQENMEEAKKEVRSLEYFVSHVPENEKIAISNIL